MITEYGLYLYGINNRKCRNLRTSLPVKRWPKIGAMTNDKRYFIVFDSVNGDIYIIDTKYIIILKSKLKLPIFKGFHVIIPKYKLSDEMTVHGYVRYLWEKNEIRYIPHYLIQIIGKCYENEMVHLFKKINVVSWNNWQVIVSDILDNAIQI